MKIHPKENIYSGLLILAAGLLMLAPAGYTAEGVFCNVMDYGAVADGNTLTTEFLQRAIDNCAEKGGGTVFFPAGDYLTGPLFLSSNITLYIDAGATLYGSKRFEDYPVIEGRWEGINRKVYASLITAIGADNIAIIGRGTLNGQGQPWWDGVDADRDENRRRYKKAGDRNYSWEGMTLEYPRPRVINLYHCKNIRIRDITILDSPSWTVHPVYCENIVVDGITITSPPESYNTDGVNPDSCKNVTISNCHISCGDDCITIKSGYNEYGREVGVPCENITITNCVFEAGHGGLVIGSEMSGDVRNITISNCVFDGTKRGLRAKTTRGRGGVVEHIRASNLVMRNCPTVLSLTMYYGSDAKGAEPVDEGTPKFRNIRYSNIIAYNCREAADFRGLPESPIEDITLTNIVMDVQKGMNCSGMKNFVLRDVTINTGQDEAYKLESIDGLELDMVTSAKPLAGQPVFEMNNVRDVRIHDCAAAEGTGTFFDISGVETSSIQLYDNDLSNAAQAIQLAEDVPADAIVE